MRQRYAINAVGKRLRGHYDSTIDAGPGRTMEDVIDDYLAKKSLDEIIDEVVDEEVDESKIEKFAMKKSGKAKKPEKIKPAKKPAKKVDLKDKARSGKARKD